MQGPTVGERCVLHVMGKHAGEGSDAIFERKRNDLIQDNPAGHTVWVTTLTNGKRLAAIRALIATDTPVYVYFISGSTPNNTRDHKTTGVARQYKSISGLEASSIPKQWTDLPHQLSPVSGSIQRAPDKRAMIFTELEYDMNSTAMVDLSRMALLDGEADPTSEGLKGGRGGTLNAGANCKIAVQYTDAPLPTSTNTSRRAVWARAKLVDLADFAY